MLKLTEGAGLHHEVGIEGAEAGKEIYKERKTAANPCQTRLSVSVLIHKRSQRRVKGLKRWRKGSDANKSDGAYQVFIHVGTAIDQ